MNSMITNVASSILKVSHAKGAICMRARIYPAMISAFRPTVQALLTCFTDAVLPVVLHLYASLALE
jgi:hypothetical protein